MARRRMLWQLYPSYLLITLLALLAAGWYTAYFQKETYVRQVASGLEARAHLLTSQVTQHMERDRISGLDALVTRLGQVSNTRISVIDTLGIVLAESHEDAEVMENHASRPEIAQALMGKVGQEMRFSNTLQTRLLYVAIPAYANGQMIGVVRTAVPVTFIDQAINEFRVRMFLGLVIAALLAAGAALFVSRRMSRLIADIREGAERFAAGNLNTMLPEPDISELAGLARAMNSMARQLHERIALVTQQRNEQQAILASMMEGVIAVDTEERLININEAAARLLHIDLDTAAGRTVHELVRNTELLQLIETVLKSGREDEKEFSLAFDRQRVIQAHGSVLQGADNENIGALIVLNDITRLRRLENVRRDFVANVSHELKTPITSIKGYVETLQEGVDDPTANKRFLATISRQVNRLNAIIDDLLSLSRLEQMTEAPELERRDCPLSEILSVSARIHAERAAKREMRIELDAPEGVRVRVNPSLLEQAVNNLIDNAIKYSPDGSEVRVTGEADETEVRITVSDNGPGIPREHLNRIFERFYRADKGRSRELGGTGLGLAIVKHIALAHGGQVTVESTVGEGSRFTIVLPRLTR